MFWGASSRADWLDITALMNISSSSLLKSMTSSHLFLPFNSILSLSCNLYPFGVHTEHDCRSNARQHASLWSVGKFDTLPIKYTFFMTRLATHRIFALREAMNTGLKSSNVVLIAVSKWLIMDEGTVAKSKYWCGSKTT